MALIHCSIADSNNIRPDNLSIECVGKLSEALQLHAFLNEADGRWWGFSVDEECECITAAVQWFELSPGLVQRLVSFVESLKRGEIDD